MCKAHPKLLKKVENDEKRSGSTKQLCKHKKNAHKPVNVLGLYSPTVHSLKR